MTFKELPIRKEILRSIEEVGYETPSPIQEQAIPIILKECDVVGCAQTGTGKTAAFAIPILERLARKSNKSKKHIRTLILTPTRELAIQIHENFNLYGTYLPLKTTVIFGGVPQNPQIQALQNGVDILIATPGRLNDLYQQGYIKLDRLEIFVLDEADRMLDMGFVHDVKRILTYIPIKRQTLLFSATMPPEIKKLAQNMLKKPIHIEVTPVSSTADTVSQAVYKVDKLNKLKLLKYIVREQKLDQVLVFMRTKHGADKAVKKLVREKINAQAIHGDKSQNARQKALTDFKNGDLQILLATDIAARGIDISELPMVINYDLPEVPETYVHRIGRTGRAGMEGKSISFCNFDELDSLKGIEKLIGKKILEVKEHPYPMEIFEATPKVTQQRPSRDKKKKIKR